MISAIYRLRRFTLAGALVLAASPAFAQESKSAALASELAKLMDQMKADSIAAHHPAAPDQFVGALYFPGSQLLVVTARKNLAFDGDWKKAKLSEDEYMKGFQQADDEYAKMLQALLAELKKTS
jgi:hypothetical protein